MIVFMIYVGLRCVIPLCIFVMFIVQVWRRVYCVVVKFTLYVKYIYIFLQGKEGCKFHENVGMNECMCMLVRSEHASLCQAS
jgi:hypothetical protein